MATILTQKIATTGSGHMVPGPTPATSLIPPTPPAGPVPSPFAYISKSSSATKTKSKLKVGGDDVLVNGSEMTVEQPGNVPSNPTGGDIVTHVVDAKTAVFQIAQTKVKAEGVAVACTLDKARMNVPMNQFYMQQTIGTLVTADMINTAAGQALYAGKDLVILDPVAVASGAVTDESVDLALPGIIPLCWKRSYASSRGKLHTPLGRAGWTFSYHQWVEVDGAAPALCDDGASLSEFPAAEPGEVSFHRGKRLELVRDRLGGAEVRSLDTRLTRRFVKGGGGRAYLAEIVDVWGNALRFEYAGERLARIVDTAGRIVIVTHDRHGHVVELAVHAFAPGAAGAGEPPCVYKVSYAYDEDGTLIGATDALGHTESYAYDGKRRLSEKTLPNGLAFHYRYDDVTGRCVRAWGDGGIYAGQFDYDLEEGITRVSGNDQPAIYAWREDGSVIKQSSPDGAASFAFELDDDLYQLAVTNGLGEAVRYEYDERGNQTKFVEPGGVETEFEFVDDLCIQRRHAGLETDYVYDARGAVTLVRYPSGAQVSIEYDRIGRIAAVYGADGLRTAFRYDDHHNVIEQRFARGGVERFEYDALGHTIGYADPAGRALRWQRNALGLAQAVRLPDGSEERFEHDKLGRLVRHVDGKGREWRTEYAGIRSPVSVGFADGNSWQLEFDRLERPVRIENAKGESFEFRYDRAGNVCEMRTFDGRIIRSQRDRGQRASRVELPDGNWLSYEFDGAGNRVLEGSPHGGAVLGASGRTFDLLLEDPTGPVLSRAVHDEQYRIVREQQNQHFVEYEYDGRNRCVARRLSTGHVTRYEYDEESRVSAIEHDGYEIEIVRDASGAVIGRRFGGGEIDERRELDAMGRMTRQWLGKGNETLVDRSYRYGAGSELVEVLDARWGRTSYRHDELDRLIDTGSSRGREAFAYDLGGSLAQPGWELLPGGLVARADGAAYQYDACSRRVEEQKGGAKTEYRWDARSRLREVIRPDGVRVRFIYDAMGRRVRKEVFPALPDGPLTEPPPKARVVEYLWAGETLAAEIDSERGTRVYLFDPGTLAPLLQQEGDVISVVVTSSVGTSSELIAGGRVSWAARRSAWGEIVETAGDPGASHPFGLLGQYRDDETGLSYVRFRYFDAKLARFLSPDPMELGGGPNLFAFNGSPAMHVDPFGLACILIGDPRTDAFIKWILNNRVPRPGAYEIYVHGTSQGIWSNTNGSQTPQDLINRINSAGNYNGTDPMVLNSCNTGRTPTAVAQQVSQAFGNTVYAPNDLVWGQGQGTPGGNIGPMQGWGPTQEYPGHGASSPYDPARPGQWNQWNNGQGSQGNVYRPTTTYTPPAAGGGGGPPPTAPSPPAATGTHPLPPPGI